MRDEREEAESITSAHAAMKGASEWPEICGQVNSSVQHPFCVTDPRLNGCDPDFTGGWEKKTDGGGDGGRYWTPRAQSIGSNL